jgi:hypothetical protein
MTSPFPGMAPYIEEPEVWSDFHGGLAGEMRASVASAWCSQNVIAVAR